MKAAISREKRRRGTKRIKGEADNDPLSSDELALHDSERRQRDAKRGSNSPIRASLARATDGGAWEASAITLVDRLAARVSNRSLTLHSSCCHSILFHARWCAARRMTHWWRSQKSCSVRALHHGRSSVKLDFATSIFRPQNLGGHREWCGCDA